MANWKQFNLTKPQYELLCDIGSGKRTRCPAEYYKPWQALLYSGLARPFGFSSCLLTSKGMELFKNLSDTEGEK
jgi:hypothetical protein